MGYRVNSHPIHHWMDHGPSSSGVHTPPSGGWNVNQHDVPFKMSSLNISHIALI